MTASHVLFYICIALFLVILVTVLRAFRELSEFQRHLKSLSDESAAKITAQPRSELSLLLGDYVTLFDHAAAKSILSSFHVDRSASPILSRIRSLTSAPRSLVGILILGGLLVTLFNLQSSVAVLGDSFHQLSIREAQPTLDQADKGIKAIQSSMGDIAHTAQLAFSLSGWVIGMAAVGLLVSVPIHHRGQQLARKFVNWANLAYTEALTRSPADQQAQMEKFGELVDKMGDLITSFGQIGQSMATVSDFGSKLDESSRLVAEAVDRLPTTINASVVQLSGEVTKDISVHLQNQIEHLKVILAIYGDQEMRVRKIQEHLDDFSRLTQESFSAVQKLSGLPEKVDGLARSIGGLTTATANLSGTTRQLDEKVTAMPMADLRAGLTAIVPMRDAVATLKNDLANVNHSQKELAATLTLQLAKTEESLNSLLGRTSAAGVEDQIKAIGVELLSIKEAIESVPSALRIEQMTQTLLRIDDFIQKVVPATEKSLIEKLRERFTRSSST